MRRSAIVPAVHVTTCPRRASTTCPAAPTALTNVTPAGNVSTTVTPSAAFGPLLVTVIGYCTVPPALTDVGDDVFVTAEVGERGHRRGHDVAGVGEVPGDRARPVREVALFGTEVPADDRSSVALKRNVTVALGARVPPAVAVAPVPTRTRTVRGAATYSRDVVAGGVGLGAVVHAARAGGDGDRAGDERLVRLRARR